MNQKFLTALRISGLLFVLVIAAINSFDKVDLENRPAGGYDEQMWTGSAITSYNIFFRDYQRKNIMPERWFTQYAKKYSIDLSTMPKAELQWYDDAMWTFGWKAPSIGKYIMGASILHLADKVDPQGYFYEANNPQMRAKWPGNYAAPKLVRLARIPNAIMGILTIAIIFSIGWIFFNYLVGFLAGLYLSLNSLYFTVIAAAGLDAPSIFFSALTMLFVFLFLKSFNTKKSLMHILGYSLLVGIGFSLAVGSKLNAALLGYVIFILFALLFILSLVQIYKLKLPKDKKISKKEEAERQDNRGKLFFTLKQLVISAVLMGTVTYGLFVYFNPIFRSNPLNTTKIIQESVDQFFTQRAAAKKTTYLKNSWLESFKLVAKRNFIKLEKSYYSTFGRILPFKFNFLDGLFFISGLAFLLFNGLQNLLRKQSITIPLILAIWALVILYGNTDFIWVDFGRYHVAFFYSNALLVGVGITSLVDKLYTYNKKTK